MSEPKTAFIASGVPAEESCLARAAGRFPPPVTWRCGPEFSLAPFKALNALVPAEGQAVTIRAICGRLVRHDAGNSRCQLRSGVVQLLVDGCGLQISVADLPVSGPGARQDIDRPWPCLEIEAQRWGAALRITRPPWSSVHPAAPHKRAIPDRIARC